MALSQAQRKANDKYIKENYQRLPISYPKEFNAQVRKAAEASGETLAGYVRKAIEARMHSHSCTLDGERPSALDHWNEVEKK